MRKLIWQASILVLCACAAFTWMAPAASAQDDGLTVINGECFTSAVTSRIEITDTIQQNEPVVTEYETFPGSQTVLSTSEVVLEDELTLVDCPSSAELLPDEVLGLAITGSNVNMPVAVGASLIGVGGLLVAAARKRRNDLT